MNGSGPPRDEELGTRNGQTWSPFRSAGQGHHSQPADDSEIQNRRADYGWRAIPETATRGPNGPTALPPSQPCQVGAASLSCRYCGLSLQQARQTRRLLNFHAGADETLERSRPSRQITGEKRVQTQRHRLLQFGSELRLQPVDQGLERRVSPFQIDLLHPRTEVSRPDRLDTHKLHERIQVSVDQIEIASTCDDSWAMSFGG